MRSILIIITVAYVGLAVYRYAKDGSYTPLLESGKHLWIIGIGAVLLAINMLVTGPTPEGYSLLENYSYVTEEGAIETIDGPFYEKDGVYYKQDRSKANWIPFYPIEYVEVELPENHLPELVVKE